MKLHFVFLALFAGLPMGCGPQERSSRTEDAPPRTASTAEYEALSSGCYQLSLASRSLADALIALREAEAKVRQPLRQALADAADLVDAAGEGISDFVEPPEREYSAPSRREAAAARRSMAQRAAADSLEAAEQALGILESLLEDATGDDLLATERALRPLRGATDDLRAALDALGASP